MPEWTRKHLIDVEELDVWEINTLLEMAAKFKKEGFTLPPLKGMTIALLFYESSTRTSNSFATAARNIGTAVLNFSKATSSANKGETLIDTALNIEAMNVQGFVIRHSSPGAALMLARTVKGAVANGGDGRHAHPTQALLDMMTIIEVKKRIEGLNIGIVGDIAHSRVARSLMHGLRKLGANVMVTGPATMMPATLPGGVVRVSGVEEVMKHAEVLYFLRIQLERMTGGPLIPSLREYSEVYGLTPERMNRLKKEQVVMHPGPVNRGVELSAASADCEASFILPQVTNGVYVRMAVLYQLLNAVKGVKVC
jgi:aspartate carbamoyltransferase catalytic subunit